MKKTLDISDKPYFKCLSCPNFPDNKCNIPFSRMSLLDWCICMRAGKEIKHLTNAYVAEKADTSLKRVEQIFALNCDQDIRRDTARRIELTIFGESQDFVRCPDTDTTVHETSEQLRAAMIDLEHALHDKNDIQAAMENVQITHAAQIQAIQEQYNEKLTDLRHQLDRLMRNNDYLWEENNRKSRIIDELFLRLK